MTNNNKQTILDELKALAEFDPADYSNPNTYAVYHIANPAFPDHRLRFDIGDELGCIETAKKMFHC